MTWTIRHRDRSGAPMIAEYECPVHGRFEATVERDTAGDPPATAACQEWVEPDMPEMQTFADVLKAPYPHRCGRVGAWRISAPLGKVRIAEVTRGRSEAPPTKHALTTRDLAEGMPMKEWKAKRAALRDERRRAKIKAVMG